MNVTCNVFCHTAYGNICIYFYSYSTFSANKHAAKVLDDMGFFETKKNSALCLL